MTLEAADRQPAMLGWHPWFRRDVGVGFEANVHLDAALMYERDDEGIPTGTLVGPSDPPWDDCFTMIATEPVVAWGQELILSLTSSCDHWVVFTEPEHAVCVEPQTGPPDELNADPTVLEADEELTATFELRWHRPS